MASTKMPDLHKDGAIAYGKAFARRYAEERGLELYRPPQAPQPTASGSRHTLGEAWTSWQTTWSCSQGTKDARSFRWQMLLKALPDETLLSDITVVRVKRAQADLVAKHKPSSVNDVVNKTLSPTLEHAVDLGWIQANPCSSVKSLRNSEIVREQPTWAEAKRICDEAETKAPETADILRAMFMVGLGNAEIKGLRGDHIDLKTGVVRVVRKKTGKAFSVPVFEHAKPFIQGLKDTGRLKPGKPVFEWRNPRKALSAACLRLKLPVYEPRALRRTFIIHALESGCDPRAVAKWQGHRDAKLILSVYGAYVSPEHERQQAAKLKG